LAKSGRSERRAHLGPPAALSKRGMPFGSQPNKLLRHLSSTRASAAPIKKFGLSEN